MKTKCKVCGNPKGGVVDVIRNIGFSDLLCERCHRWVNETLLKLFNT